jgi:hypothetical protein
MEPLFQPVNQLQAGLGGRQLYSKEQWDTKKAIIRQLYKLENKPYNKVIELLRTEHGFFPTYAIQIT